jgi:hypothetical protein
MKAIKKSILVFILCFGYTVYPQLVITEIYHDTPYTERYDRGYSHRAHHLGEFIEIYNYTTETIPLKGWSLSDRVSVYNFPDDASIPSEGFLLVAFRDLYYGPDTGNYFPSFFPNTQGQENKILYQGNMMMRNDKEEVHINMGPIRGINFDHYPIFKTSWYSAMRPVSNEDPRYEDTSHMNYYLDSFQLGESNIFSKAAATPLYANYVPPTQRLEDIPEFQEAVTQNTANITWEYYSNLLLEMSCPVVIPQVEQPAMGNYSEVILCFDYDPSGNTTIIYNCSDEENDPESPNTENLYTEEEIEDISSRIGIYPNPTYGNLTIAWDDTVDGKITQIRINNFSGVSIGEVPITENQSSANFDISGQPATVYITTFTLNTGQLISKNVIKL